MMIVYKYYPWNEYTIDALNKGYFFFCKAAKQNDPYDCSFKLIEGSRLAKCLIKKRIIHPESERIMADYGTCSFSEVKDNMHLWAFYADNFNGIVVGYDDTTFGSITKNLLARISYYEVTYLPNIIDVDNPDTQFILKEINNRRCVTIKDCFKGDPKKDDDFFAYLCSIKAEHTWREERERRLIAAGDIMNGRARLEKKKVEYLPNGYKIPMPPKCVKEIIIGHNFNKNKYCCIKCIARNHGIADIYKTVTNNPFKIDFELVDI